MSISFKGRLVSNNLEICYLNVLCSSVWFSSHWVERVRWRCSYEWKFFKRSISLKQAQLQENHNLNQQSWSQPGAVMTHDPMWGSQGMQNMQNTPHGSMEPMQHPNQAYPPQGAQPPMVRPQVLHVRLFLDWVKYFLCTCVYVSPWTISPVPLLSTTPDPHRHCKEFVIASWRSFTTPLYDSLSYSLGFSSGRGLIIVKCSDIMTACRCSWLAIWFD